MSQLIPNKILDTLPLLYSTENKKDPIAHVKLFTPDSSWSWYITEYNPEDKICFGLVSGHEVELGYFSLTELEQVRGPLGLHIEMDRHFKPSPLSVVKKQM